MIRRRDFLVSATAVATSSLAGAQDQTGLTQSDFSAWLAEVRDRAVREGVPAADFDAALDGLTLDPVVIARRAAAAETNRTISDYVLSLLKGRGTKARQKYLANQDTLDRIESRFGVPGGVLTAFWGMESDYGANIGDRDVLRAVATHGAAGSGRATD